MARMARFKLAAGTQEDVLINPAQVTSVAAYRGDGAARCFVTLTDGAKPTLVLGTFDDVQAELDAALD